jgi:hypothetical protein
MDLLLLIPVFHNFFTVPTGMLVQNLWWDGEDCGVTRSMSILRRAYGSPVIEL